MADPHRRDRYGETWDLRKISLAEADLFDLRDHLTLSGGWAWHFLSPEGHVELKHAHDHKDMDAFVAPALVAELSVRLAGLGYQRVGTRFDKRPAPYPFRRLERSTALGRLTLDLFTGEVPRREVRGYQVVDPRYLLGLYETVHMSKTCFAVSAARNLLARGIDPQGRAELVSIPRT